MFGVVIQFTNDGRARAVNLEYLDQGQKKKPARGLRSRTSHSYVSDLLTNADFYKENTTDKKGSQGENAKKTDREASGTDARTILSGALMDVAQTDEERKLLTKYQSEIAERNAEEVKLNETRREIRDMMHRLRCFTKALRWKNPLICNGIRYISRDLRLAPPAGIEPTTSP